MGLLYLYLLYDDARSPERQVLRSVHITYVASAWYNEFFVSSLPFSWRNFADARVGFLRAILINAQVFWDVTPCGLVKKSPKFRCMVLPTSSGPIDPLGLLEPEDGGKMLIRKVGNYLPIGKS